ncbi:MAG: MEDS domain-containing protein [Methanosarcina sp.]|nr:hypothetical protein BGV40_12915 [Methanosarcina sp. Ant1]
MKENLRNSGIDIVGDVPWGTHFCQLYQTKEDLMDILLPYFKAGLENNEFCVWVTSESLDAEEAKDDLRRTVPDFSTSPTGSRNHLASFRFQNTFRLNV